MTPITTEHGLALFDAALTYQHPACWPARCTVLCWPARHAQHTLPAILSALTHIRPHAATTSPQTLAARLAGQTPAQQHATLTTLVATATATVLAHPDPAALDPDRPFKDLGIDSLTALELRNTLAGHTGLALPATLVFDHPTPTAIATYLAGLLTTGTTSTATPSRRPPRRVSMSRSPWWGWRAGSLGVWIRRRRYGIWLQPVGMRWGFPH